MKTYVATKPIPANILVDRQKIEDERWIHDHMCSTLDGVPDISGDLGYIVQDWVSQNIEDDDIVDQNGWEFSAITSMESDGLVRFNLYPYNWVFDSGKEWDFWWDAENNPYARDLSQTNGHIIYVEGYFIDTQEQEFFTTKLTFSDKLP